MKIKKLSAFISTILLVGAMSNIAYADSLPPLSVAVEGASSDFTIKALEGAKQAVNGCTEDLSKESRQGLTHLDTSTVTDEVGYTRVCDSSNDVLYDNIAVDQYGCQTIVFNQSADTPHALKAKEVVFCPTLQASDNDVMDYDIRFESQLCFTDVAPSVSNFDGKGGPYPVSDIIGKSLGGDCLYVQNMDEIDYEEVYGFPPQDAQ